MSRLEKLIKEFCPNGVEYKILGDIGKISMCKRIMKSETAPNGDVPFYKIGTFGQIANAYISKEIFEEYRNTYPYPNKGDILISAAGTIGRTVIFDGNPAYFQDSNIVWVENDESKVLNKFLYYYYQLQPWKISSGGTIVRLYNEQIRQTEIPVPPLPVQEEIVRILDNFTALTSELMSELTLRKKQYEYYRDRLLTFIDGVNGVRFIPLNRAAKIYDGTHQTPEYKYNGIPFISVENINNIYNSQKYISREAFARFKIKPRKGDLLMTRIGSIGKCAVFDHDAEIAYYVSLALIRPNETILSAKYLRYIIESTVGRRELRKKTLVNAVPIKINKDDIGKIILPVPPLAEQQRIVSILDRFDALCNDISSGLPAEIAARQKQYEYYRDKLLTFKEVPIA